MSRTNPATPPYWNLYHNGPYREWVFRIGYLVGSVSEMEPKGHTYTEQDFDPATPKAYLAKLGARMLPTGSSIEVQHLYFDKPEEAMRKVEREAVATSLEVLQEVEVA